MNEPRLASNKTEAVRCAYESVERDVLFHLITIIEKNCPRVRYASTHRVCLHLG